MIKIKYKDFDIECYDINDAIKFIDHFCPQDRLEVKVAGEVFLEDEELEHPHKDEDNNIDRKEYIRQHNKSKYKDHIIDPESGFSKSEEKMACDYLGITKVTGEDENIVCIYFNDFVTYMHKQAFYAMILVTLKEMPHDLIIPTLKESLEKEVDVKLEKVEKPKIPQPINNPIMATIGSKHIEVGNPPKPGDEIFNTDTLLPKKKRGRPKKEIKDAGDINDLGTTKPLESIQIPSSIMGIDDIVNELKTHKAMAFNEEALRKIFQNLYKPSLKTIVKATWPLTQLDPQMCNIFVSEVSDKLGMKCTLSYKVTKDGFIYILMK